MQNLITGSANYFSLFPPWINFRKNGFSFLMISEAFQQMTSMELMLDLPYSEFHYLFGFFFCSGIVEPIKSGIRDSKLGIGKQEEDDFFTSEENIQRKKLEVEIEETEDHAKKREVCP